MIKLSKLSNKFFKTSDWDSFSCSINFEYFGIKVFNKRKFGYANKVVIVLAKALILFSYNSMFVILLI